MGFICESVSRSSVDHGPILQTVCVILRIFDGTLCVQRNYVHHPFRNHYGLSV